MCSGTSAPFFACLFTHKSFKGGSLAWPLSPVTGWPLPKTLCLVTLNVSIAEGGNSPHQPSLWATPGHTFYVKRESIISSLFPVITLWPRYLSTQAFISYYPSSSHQLVQNICGRVRKPASSGCSAEYQTLNHNLELFETALSISLSFICVSDYQFLWRLNPRNWITTLDKYRKNLKHFPVFK